MGELTYSIPSVGELVTTACPKVDTALTQIKTEVNGKIEATNVKNESLEVKNIVKSGKWVNEGEFGAAVKKGEHFEREPSATENALVLLTLVLSAGAVTTSVIVKVGGIKVAGLEFTEGGPVIPVGAFRVPATEKWLVEVSAGSTGQLESTSSFAYMKGVV